jgi:hypothetical protein
MGRRHGCRRCDFAQPTALGVYWHMPNTAEKLMSLDEFLAWEREQPERHEFDGFTVTAMTGLRCRT